MGECKIVQDLLDVYIEHLTSQTTNEYIEAHLRLCNKCKRKLDRMRNCIKTREDDCKIIYDLLPNYIEKLTSNNTNRYIKHHLKTCNKCNQVWLDMTSEITIEDFERATFLK